MPLNDTPWQQGFEQAIAGVERDADPDVRILAIRSLRYHMTRAEDDSQLSRNIRILEVFSSILSGCRQSPAVAGTQSRDRNNMPADMRGDPVVLAIGDVLRRVFARPNHGIGCFDHPGAWCMDFLDLRACHFSGSQLEQTSFHGARLGRSDFTSANLERADFTSADLTSANFAHAVLSGAELSGANMAWADLSNAKMEGIFANHTNFSGAILDHVTLVRALLSGADMTKTSLTGADLHGANMFAVHIHEAKLEHAVLAGTGITKDRIDALGETVRWNVATRWGSNHDRDERNPLNHEYYTPSRGSS